MFYLNKVNICFDETIKASFNETTIDLDIIDDSRAEREETCCAGYNDV